MKNNQQNWYPRVMLWLTVAFATGAIVQTTLVSLVLHYGQTITLSRWSVGQQNYYDVHQHPSGRIRLEYHYTIDGTPYSGETLAIAHQTNDPRLGYFAMPFGHHDGKYELRVWKKFPAFACPMLSDHSPYSLSQLLWIVTLILCFLSWLMRIPSRRQVYEVMIENEFGKLTPFQDMIDELENEYKRRKGEQ